MSEFPPVPNFPSRRSLHGSGADPNALEEALTSIRHATLDEPTQTLPGQTPELSSAQAASTPTVPTAPSSSAETSTPRRRSFKERLAEIEQKKNEIPPQTPVLGIPVGSGEVSLPGDSFTSGFTGAYTSFSEGTFEESLTNTGLVPIIDVETHGEPLDRATALEHHLFAVPDDVESDEIEALAVSIWDDAAWAMPGCLRLVGESYLRGPWRIEPELAKELGFAADLSRVWVLQTPKRRAAPPRYGNTGSEIPSNTQPATSPAAYDPWAEAFPDGVPLGVEYKALLALVRMGRRLGGALRVAGTGMIMRPSPQSAVNMAVYAPRWVGPEDMHGVLSSQFDGVLDSREMTASAAEPNPTQVRRIASVMASAKPLDPQVAEVLKKAREEAARQPQRIDGYALIIPSVNGMRFMVEAHRVMRPPRVLRWEPWTNGTIMEYQIRWNPANHPGTLVGIMDRNPDPADLDACARASQVVEQISALVARATEGMIVDEDGFLVGLDD